LEQRACEVAADREVPTNVKRPTWICMKRVSWRCRTPCGRKPWSIKRKGSCTAATPESPWKDTGPSQRRVEITWLTKDSMGLCERDGRFLEGIDEDRMTVFGEWCGRGVQRGNRAKRGQRKPVRDIRYSSQLEPAHRGTKGYRSAFRHKVSPHSRVTLASCRRPRNDNRRLYEVGLEDLEKTVLKRINKATEAIEKVDPWVKEHFQIEGPGEGLVFYPTTSAPKKPFSSSTSSRPRARLTK